MEILPKERGQIFMVLICLGVGCEKVSCSRLYRARSKRLAEQRAVQEVEFFYRHAGLDMKTMYSEKADHAGVELAFMKGLVLKEIQARQSGHMSLVHCYTQWQRQFLENHLAQWFGALNRQLESKVVTDFYRLLAKLAWHFVRTDYNILNGARL